MTWIKRNYIPLFLSFALCLACIGMWWIAGHSEEFIHPDELQTKPAVLYYTQNSRLPDVRDLSDDYFSGYGMTRLWELSIYYFLAGKVASCFSMFWNYRLFNVLLGICISVIAIRNVRSHPEISLAFCLTPQLWYLYSYATSDAWDYFLCFLCLLQVVHPKSMLHKILDQPNPQSFIWLRYLAVGTLFGLTLFSKKNFYLIPLWLGFYFFFTWLRSDKNKRQHILKSCLFLLITAFLVLGIRLAMDYSVYGTQKGQIVTQQMELRAQPDYKLSIPASEQAPSYHLREKGVSLPEMLFRTNFHLLLGETFCGLYGAYAFGTNPVYYILYGLIFLSLLILLFHKLWKTEQRYGKWECITLAGLMALSYVLVVINAWITDFQPQGRYLFPCLILICYGISIVPDLLKNKYFSLCFLALTALSTASFLGIAAVRL